MALGLFLAFTALACLLVLSAPLYLGSLVAFDTLFYLGDRLRHGLANSRPGHT